ncbi:hypothetical protein C0991_003642 [Blastosporella zonata]|nr:hypothetical protein C0991_003642 [Blastosporella zonata]
MNRHVPLDKECKEFDSYYEMVSNSNIMPGSEIFNTYGETLSNSQLLAQYGFTLDVNENDRICWTSEEVSITFSTGPTGGAHPHPYLPAWEYYLEAVVPRADQSGMYARLSESGLIYCQEDDDNTLCLDSDGRISHQLWTFLALPLCLRADRGNIDNQLGDVTADLKKLLEFQLIVEGADKMNEDQGDNHYLYNSPKMKTMLTTLARSAINLCVSRKCQLGKKGSDDLNEILDVGILPSCGAGYFTY